MRGEWFLTGDQGAMDADGHVTYLGRADDMMNAGGFRVSPLEVEAALHHASRHRPQVGVTDIEVKPDVRIIAAFYTGPRAIDEDVLKAFAAERLARYKQPRAYVHLDALPTGANGKLLRRALRGMFPYKRRPLMVKLDIMSDPICPWCYIGKAHLDRGAGRAPRPPVRDRMAPVPAQPRHAAPSGMDRRAYLEAKFGGKEAAAQVYARIDAAAREAGLEIDFAAITRTPNTVDAHRLIHWAGVEGRQTAAVAALFDAYFQQGRDIGDAEVLADIADGLGMDAAVVRAAAARRRRPRGHRRARQGGARHGRKRGTHLHRRRPARGARRATARNLAEGHRRDRHGPAADDMTHGAKALTLSIGGGTIFFHHGEGWGLDSYVFPWNDMASGHPRVRASRTGKPAGAE